MMGELLTTSGPPHIHLLQQGGLSAQNHIPVFNFTISGLGRAHCRLTSSCCNWSQQEPISGPGGPDVRPGPAIVPDVNKADHRSVTGEDRDFVFLLS